MDPGHLAFLHGCSDSLAASASGFSGWLRHRALRQGYVLDAAQLAAAGRLERLGKDLAELERRSRWLPSLLARRRKVPGVYLWGGVGRGKSFLMDSFFGFVPVERKKRIHFHRFMQEIHHRLQRHSGMSDPLIRVSREVARQARLLCLDELHIADIGDAMLMKGLLEGLFAEGVVLVTTSNQAPDELYLHGLQRSRFFPAIELLKDNLDVVAMDGGADYRLRSLERVEIYHAPLDGAAQRNLESAFRSIAGEEGKQDACLEVEGRRLKARRLVPGVAWFDFQELCGGSRSRADYVELARRFHTVLLSDVPRLGPGDGDRVRRLTWLVDEFYDRRVKLIVSAAAPLQELYPRHREGADWERTISRLTEMQTRRYLGLPHLP